MKKEKANATEPLTKVQIEKTALTVALSDISKFGEGVLIIAGDLKTDLIYAFFNGQFIPAQIKGNNGENIGLIKKVLEYNDDEHAVNSFLHFVDGVIFAFAEKMKQSIGAIKTKVEKIKKTKKSKKK